MQQKLAQKEKAAKEEHLRLLAQRARDDRAGITTSATPALPSKAVEKGMGGALGGYGSESDSESDSGSEDGAQRGGRDDVEDDEEVRIREKIRREQKQEREREMRMQSMGNEQRAKMIARYVLSVLQPYQVCFDRLKPTLSSALGSKTGTSLKRLLSAWPNPPPTRKR